MSRAPDMTGQRFGRLTVIERAGSSSAGNVTWRCSCDCGNTTNSAGSDLRRGRTQSCGCAAADATRRRHTEGRALEGQRFGRLIVLEFAGLNSYPRAMWLCRCDCGQKVTITGHHLTSGDTVSCGCRQQEIMALRPTWLIKPVVGYTAAHGRVKYLHGPAAAHACVDCGDNAQDWSYDKSDPTQLVDERGRPYSLDPTCYVPRCRSCHRRHDAAHNNSLTPTGVRSAATEGATT